MKYYSFVLSFLLLPLLLSAQSINKEKLDSLFLILENNNQTMASIHVTKNGASIYSNSTGYSSVEDKIEANQNTRYRIGSITKVYTATIIFQMVDEGKITLETSLKEFYPEIPNAKKISIGRLLNHSSGIYNITTSKDFDPQAAKTQMEIVSKIAGFTPNFEPDTKSEYSNSNYILLGYIAEKIDQKPYAEILIDRISEKLDLSSTYYGGPIDPERNEAYSYIYKQTWERSRETNLNLPHGAGAIVSTPEELTIFINSLFTKQLISKESLAQMITQNNNTGFGIAGYNLDGLQIYGHDGGIDGFSSLLIYIPQFQLSIAFTSNGNRYPMMEIVRSALMASNNLPFDLPSF